jgi:hypothetical protein
MAVKRLSVRSRPPMPTCDHISPNNSGFCLKLRPFMMLCLAIFCQIPAVKQSSAPATAPRTNQENSLITELEARVGRCRRSGRWGLESVGECLETPPDWPFTFPVGLSRPPCGRYRDAPPSFLQRQIGHNLNDGSMRGRVLCL